MKQVPGFPKYFCTEDGRIFSTADRGILKEIFGHKNKVGYVDVCFTSDNSSRNVRKWHRVVAETFLPDFHNKPFVNHKDGNKSNNRLDNLEMVTALENIRHAHKLGLIQINGEYNKSSKLTEAEVLFIKSLFGLVSQKNIALMFGVHISTIERISMGKSWSYLNNGAGRIDSITSRRGVL